MILKGDWKYDRSKLKLLNSLNKNRTFIFDLLYFWCPLRYRVIQYLILKLSYVVLLSQEGYVLAVLLSCVKSSWKKPFYYIKRLLSNLILTGLYHNFRNHGYYEAKERIKENHSRDYELWKEGRWMPTPSQLREYAATYL